MLPESAKIQAMSEIINSSLKSAAKGTALVFVGMVSSIILWFATKLLIVRSTSKEELGVYSLSVAIISICSLLPNLGLQEGVARYISIYLGENKKDHAAAISRDAIVVGVLASLVVFVAVFLLSGTMSKYLFYKPELEIPLRAMSVFIPFAVIANIANGILRGNNIIRPKVYADIGQPFLFLVFLCLFVLLKLPFISIIYAYVLAMVLISSGIIAYLFRKIKLSFKTYVRISKKELLRFSIPLLATSVMAIVLGWTDTLMLGRYATAEDVGVYNISMSLARLLNFPLGAVSFVYMPVAAEMLARKQYVELNRTYQILTKWVFSVTLPIFFILFFFPEMTITFLFGASFVDASDSLRILSVCFLFHAFLGANGVILLVMGMSRMVMILCIGSAVLNIVLNYVLIKQFGYGVNGASIATLVSYIALNVTTSVILYKYSKIHPITIKYVKPVIGSLFIGVLIYILAKSLPLYYWMLPLYFALFILGYYFALLMTRSLDSEDISMFETISEKTGLEMKMLKKLVCRFARH